MKRNAVIFGVPAGLGQRLAGSRAPERQLPVMISRRDIDHHLGQPTVVYHPASLPDPARLEPLRLGQPTTPQKSRTTSKRARTQTTISTEGISLTWAGLDLANTHLGGLAARHAVVVATGSTGKLAARLVREAAVGRLSVASRSQERAAEVAAAVHGRQLRTSDVPVALADADILVTATGAAAPSCSPSTCAPPGHRPAAGRCSSSTWACHPTWTPELSARAISRILGHTA
jgi:hypothetical protein